MGEEQSLIQVDKNRLDEEWVRQPELYHRAAVDLADARAALAIVKAELDLTEAEVGLDIRTEPGRFGLKKAPSEKLVESLVRMDMRYQTVLKSYNLAKHDADVIEAAVRALDHRKEALKSLVILHGQDYFQTDMRVKEGGDRSINRAVQQSARQPLRKRK